MYYQEEFAAKEKFEIVNVRGFTAIFCPPFTPSRAPRGEEIPFELSLKYTAMVKNFLKIIGGILVLALIGAVAYVFMARLNVAKAPAEQPQNNTITIKDKKITDNAKPFSIAITYPFASGLDNFNQKAEDIINEELKAFKEYSLDIDESVKENDPEGYAKYPSEYTLEISYEKGWVDEDIISIVFAVSSFTGGAHGSNYSIALNYDIKNKKEIVLAEMFAGIPDYLEKISDYCIKDLAKQIKEVSGSASIDSAWIADGAGPKAENFQTFMIKKDSLVFYFPQYQVASYAAGDFKVEMPR